MRVQDQRQTKHLPDKVYNHNLYKRGLVGFFLRPLLNMVTHILYKPYHFNRIDFERFSLGQPTKLTSESAYTCERDEFTLITNGNTKINVPVLCGENAGQHGKIMKKKSIFR